MSELVIWHVRVFGADRGNVLVVDRRPRTQNRQIRIEERSGFLGTVVRHRVNSSRQNHGRHVAGIGRAQTAEHLERQLGASFLVVGSPGFVDRIVEERREASYRRCGMEVVEVSQHGLDVSGGVVVAMRLAVAGGEVEPDSSRELRIELELGAEGSPRGDEPTGPMIARAQVVHDPGSGTALVGKFGEQRVVNDSVRADPIVGVDPVSAGKIGETAT